LEKGLFTPRGMDLHWNVSATLSTETGVWPRLDCPNATESARLTAPSFMSVLPHDEVGIAIS
jgi:hypothetical protein